MRSSAVLIVILLSAVMALCSAADTSIHNKRCAVNSRGCGSHTDCCSGCCSEGKCSTYDLCSVASQGACALHNCPVDKECYLQKVQCVTAPCPPIPACRPKNSDDYNYD